MWEGFVVKNNVKYMLSAACAVVLWAGASQARDQVRVVGSSTVFPFVAAAAEMYGEKTGNNAPIVESIGTGVGFLEFCKGVGEKYPDIASSSRLMLEEEKKLCHKKSVGEVLEVPIGLDGIVLAHSLQAKNFALTKQQIFNALAKEIIVDGKVLANPNQLWSDVDAKLPQEKIEVYGPSSTSGTRDSFVELVFEPVCKNNETVKEKFKNEAELKNFCHSIREDGAYIEAGENDNLIVQKLSLNKNAIGIFGYNYLEQSLDKVQPISVDGVSPDFETIADGSYPVARKLYIYVKLAHLKLVANLKGFVQEMIDNATISEDGYLVDKGLVPLSNADLKALHELVTAKIK